MLRGKAGGSGQNLVFYYFRHRILCALAWYNLEASVFNSFSEKKIERVDKQILRVNLDHCGPYSQNNKKLCQNSEFQASNSVK